MTGKELRTLEGHSSGIRSVMFSPDGTRIVSGSHDRSIKLWDAETGAEIRTINGHTNNVFSVAFSPDGTSVALYNGVSVGVWAVGDVLKNTAN